MTFQDRLKQFLDHKCLSYRAFEIACGFGNGTAKRFNESIKKRTVDSIVATYPELNASWLVAGKGEMLKSTPAPAQHGNLIPFYDAQTSGGYEGRVASSAEVAVVEGYIDAGGWFGGRETAAIRHVGDSMAEYPDGCILAVREVLDARLLVPGKVYVVETSEYRVTKRYQRGSTAETIALYSSNEERYTDGRLVHEPFEVLKEDVRHIFLVLGYIVNQSGEIRIITPNA